MDSIAFTLLERPFTYGEAALAGFSVIALLLVWLLIAILRGNSRRISAEGDAAANALREGFTQQISDRNARISQLEEREQRLVKSNTDLEARAASLQTRLDEQSRHAEENLQRFQAARQQMTDEFKAVAGEILKTNSENFTKLNQEQVGLLLKPLREGIDNFQRNMVQDRAAMGEQIAALTRSNLEITSEAQNLTKALKGNSQTQGAWGEMILATILERSGLREGEQYFTQQTHAGDDGSRLRTDVEIVMPNGDKMIIDSKVSLTAFEAFTNCEDDLERAAYLSDHITSLRSHIKTLAGKEYHRHAQSGLDFVFMFVPIESAFSVAVTREPGLIDQAISQGVMITTPTTLMSALRTVRNVWDIEKRHENAELIADRAGALYDKVASFLSNMDKIGENIDRARKSYDEAKGQLSGGRGNVVRQVEMLRELGAKTTKALPQGWDSDDESSVVRLTTDTKNEADEPRNSGDS